MPPDLRRVAEEQAARWRTQALTSTGSQEFTISDSEGRVHTYHTLDEMPPEPAHSVRGCPAILPTPRGLSGVLKKRPDLLSPCRM